MIDGTNMFGYVRNEPILWNDPFGMVRAEPTPTPWWNPNTPTPPPSPTPCPPPKYSHEDWERCYRKCFHDCLYIPGGESFAPGSYGGYVMCSITCFFRCSRNPYYNAGPFA